MSRIASNSTRRDLDDPERVSTISAPCSFQNEEIAATTVSKIADPREPSSNVDRILSIAGEC